MIETSTIGDLANDRYWSMYDWARPFAEQEARDNPELIDAQKDYRQYLPVDPSHPRAYIPGHVRWAKRKQVEFKCPITGWSETDWYRGIGGGPYRKVGVLTMDHTIPGALGGMTTDENIRAISMLANCKKGHKQVTDEQLREQIFNSYKVVFMPEDLLVVLNKYGVTQYKVGL